MVYVGQSLRSGTGGIEPALINPMLPVDVPVRDRRSGVPDPTPSYHLLSSTHRAGYLAWLAGGRREVDVPPGLVRLFLSGLERRVLIDAERDPSARAEFPAIAAEVRRLRELFAPVSRSLTLNAVAFEQVLHLLTAGVDADPWSCPPCGPGGERWPVPIELRVALAQFAVCRVPVPPAWARAWSWYHPDLFPSTPQTRCPQEFDTLFAVRYRARLPEGLVPAVTGRQGVRIGYQPVSPGLDALSVARPDLPDVLQEPRATRELGALSDSVTEALTPYSRWLARAPAGRGSAASAALLPEDLVRHDPGPLAGLSAWAEERLGPGQSTVADGSDFAPFWSTADPAAMSREESASLAVVLERIGLGVEPDVRFGAPPLRPGPAVVFRLDGREAPPPSAGFRAAATVLGVVAGTVLNATGPSHEAAVNGAVTALAVQIRLTVGERTRLAARLRWLLAFRPARTTLRRRTESLTADEREAAGRAVLTMADGPDTRAPATIEALELAYRWLGLPEESLHRQLHRRDLDAAGGTDPDAPVLVRRGTPDRSGHALPRVPPPPASPRVAAPESTERAAPPSGRSPRIADPADLSLDRDLLARRLTETHEVSSLLTEVFAECDGNGPGSGFPAPTANAGPVPAPTTAHAPTQDPASAPEDPPEPAGPPPCLDRAHARLLQDLAARPFWPHEEFRALTDRHGVLPQGAVDVVNETALEIAGEILLAESAPSSPSGAHPPVPEDPVEATMGDRMTTTGRVAGWEVDGDVLREMLG